MKDKIKGAVIAIVVIAALAGGGAVIAGASGGDDERPITGSALSRASSAALKHTGGGRVTETEAGDEDGAYEVEVTRADGSQVDVHLDRSFRVIDAQSEPAGEDEGTGDDD